MATKKACLQGPSKETWREETWSALTLSDLVMADTRWERQSCKSSGPVPCRALKVITGTLNCPQKATEASIAHAMVV